MQSNKIKEDEDDSPSNSRNSSEEEDEDDNEEELNNSFVADDDEEIQYEEQQDRERKRKHSRIKRKKRRRQEEVDEELLEDDLELLAENQRQGFTKLRKKQAKEEVFEKRQQRQQDQEDDLVENQNNYDGLGYQQEYQEEESDINDHYQKENNIEDIFEPGYDQFLLKNEDQIMIDHDVPQRLLLKYKDRPQQADMTEYLKEESQWLYQKLRDRLDSKRNESKVKQSIYKVLELLRIQYCEIMYIYYYKRSIWFNDLSLDILWRIYELDDEWAIIKNMKKHLVQVIFPQLESLNAEIEPSIHRLLEETTDIKTLRYIKQYSDYQLLKKGKINRKEAKRSTLTKTILEVSQHPDIISFIERQKVWLTPAQLYHNIREKDQKFKPKTPVLNPKDEIQNFIKNRPYLNESEIFLTIAAYLKQELFNYPDLRRWMKQKYTKKSVITTVPTKKGQEDIGLYSLYYPVKRIEKKSVSSFKSDLWTLVTEAEKNNLIKVHIIYDWESITTSKAIENDPIYKQMIQLYFDHSNKGNSITDFWNLLRKQILQDFIVESFTPFLRKQIKQDLSKEAEKEILTACGNKFKSQLNKGPFNRDGKPTVVMGMVLEGQKLGLAIVDEDGSLKFKGSLKIPMLANLNTVVTDKAITEPIEQFKPQLIVVAANCRQALTLRKQLRETKGSARLQRGEYCSLGDYQICSKIAKYQTFKTGTNEQRAVLEAISLCRLQQNAMAEILNLWSQKIDDNGCLMLNLHPLQKTLNKYKLKTELERVANQMVNLVGLDLLKVKDNSHLQKQVQFVCGLGYKKSIHFLQKIKNYEQKQLRRRLQLHTDNIVGKVVYRNCSAFFKICTSYHLELLQHGKVLDKRLDKENSITLLDMTRIHDESYNVVQQAAMVAVGDTGKKKMDYEQCIAEVMKNPGKFKTVQFDRDTIDMNFISQQLHFPFRDPRQPDRIIDNKDAFFSILRQSPETLKKFMVFSARIVNISQNSSFLNVKILDNGLFGSIRLPSEEDKKKYTKDSIIKAVITRFPFEPSEQKKHHTSDEDKQDQQLLKVEMALNFPHQRNNKPNHDCLKQQCYRYIVKQIHPKIDLEHFTIKKQDIPVIEVRQQVRNRVQLRLFNHPKFKNMGITQAIEWISSQQIGQFIVRPSATKKDYLTITWKFYDGIVCHINVRTEAKNTTPHSYTFRIQQTGKQRIYVSFDEMIESYIKPMNRLMQDVISNRKFIPLKPEQVQQKLKQQSQRDPSIIHYFFGCSAAYPKFIILFYIPKENKLIKQLIRVKDTGLLFHDKDFQGLKQLITWFKNNFTSRDYQKYIPKTGTIKFN